MIKDRLRGALAGGKGCYGLILAFLVAVFLVQSPLQASEPKAKYQVEYVNDKMTINAENVALGQLLNILGEKAGVEFRVGREQSERRVTVRLGPLPLVEGLERLLREFSYTFFFGPGDRLVKVIIVDTTDIGSGMPLSVSVRNSADRAEPPVGQVNQGPPSIVTSEGDRVVIEPSGPERVTFTSSAGEEMVVNPPVVEDMVVIPSAEKMVIAPPVERGMIINSPTEPMHIEYHSGVNMSIKGYTGGNSSWPPK